MQIDSSNRFLIKINERQICRFEQMMIITFSNDDDGNGDLFQPVKHVITLKFKMSEF